MSYARWSADSAVYIYPDVAGGVVCCGCPLNIHVVEETYTDFFGIVHEKGGEEWFGRTLSFFSVDDLLSHLREHRSSGHPVPEYLFSAETYEPSDFEAVSA